MLEDSGSRYECPSYGLKCGACISLNSLRRILLKLSQKNDRGGGKGNSSALNYDRQAYLSGYILEIQNNIVLLNNSTTRVGMIENIQCWLLLYLKL